MEHPAAFHVLVIDDDAATRANLRDILELDDYQVETAASVADTLDRDNWALFSAVILDRQLPDGTADELLPRLRQLAPQAAVVIVTGHSDLEGAIAAIRQGAADYLVKPINADLIRNRLSRLAQQKRSQETIARLDADLRRRVTELETLLDVIPIGIAIAQDAECRHIRVNRVFAHMLGVSPNLSLALGAHPLERPPFRVFRDGRRLAPDELPLHLAAGQGAEVRDMELEVHRPDGAVVHLFGCAKPLLDEKGVPCGSVGAYMDVTEQKRAQQQRLQVERLAAIGEVYTGLAHESRNALQRSQACLERLTKRVADRPEAVELIGRLQKAQDHLHHLYEEVRTYASPLSCQCQSCHLGQVLRQTWEDLAHLRAGRTARLSQEGEDLDLQCLADPSRLEQVFRNILENALSACADPVEIRVGWADVSLAGERAVQVRVRDNGPGLTHEARQRIFEPFFTTKTKGTGLGMAITRRLVEAHGGRIAVGDGPGPGAEIIITLPRRSR